MSFCLTERERVRPFDPENQTDFAFLDSRSWMAVVTLEFELVFFIKNSYKLTKSVKKYDFSFLNMSKIATGGESLRHVSRGQFSTSSSIMDEALCSGITFQTGYGHWY